jgi:hypothetical protein
MGQLQQKQPARGTSNAQGLTSSFIIITGKHCKHIVVIALLQGLVDDSYPTWLHCISPTIFCNPMVFSNNNEG